MQHVVNRDGLTSTSLQDNGYETFELRLKTVTPSQLPLT